VAGRDREIAVLVYSGLFPAGGCRDPPHLPEEGRGRVSVRVLLGDPDSEQVADRGTGEGIDDGMAARIRNAIVLYKPLRGVDGIGFRLHRTVLYNSIYQADDQLVVNTHIYGFAASQAPVLHLRRVAGGDMVTTYLESYERVWDDATPLD
jgi:hypothetical protein